MMSIKNFLVIILMLSTQSLFSQVKQIDSGFKGRILGVVVDSTDSSPLAGANVIVEGTSIGSSTNLDGEFVLPEIAPGNYTVKVLYIGYNSKKYKVHLTKDKAVFINAMLRPVSMKGEVIEVTAQAVGQAKAINQQISSPQIVNIISPAKIRELPDENAAAALARVPGISVSREGGEANKIRIRGVDQNVFYVNGMRMTGNNLAAISSGMIGGIEVQKSFTPDKDADVTGGIVSFRMNPAPSIFRVDTWVRPGYNGLTKKFDMFYGMATISNRFFNNKLGAVLNITFDRKDRSSDQFSATHRVIGGQATSEELQPVQFSGLDLALSNLIDNRIGATFYSDYRVGEGKFYVQSFFGKIGGEQKKFINDYNPLGRDRLRYISQIEDRNKLTFLNGLGGEHYLFGGKIDWSVYYSRDEEKIPRRIILTASNGSGMHDVKTLDSTSTIQDILNLADHDLDKTQLDNVNVIDEKNIENEFGYKFDINFPFALSKAISGNIKFGGKARKVHREYLTHNNQSGFIYDWVDGTKIALKRLPDFGWKRTNKGYLGLASFVDENSSVRDYSLVNGKIYYVPDFDKIKTYVDSTIDTYLPRVYVEVNNYKGDQEFYAGYLMSNLKIGSRIDFIPGVRYEYNKYTVTGINLHSAAGGGPRENQGTEKEVTGTDIGRQWFPMAELKIKATDFSDIRLAYSHTVSRPDPKMKSPKYWERDGNIVKGNMALKPQSNYNYDLSVSFYSNVIGLFDVGLFYKKITDQVLNYTVNITDPKKFGLPDAYLGKFYTAPINNKWPGFVKGLEFSWQTHFWYLPGFLDGLLLNLNMTFMDSETRYPFFYAERIRIPEPPYVKQVGKDSSRVNTIIGMPKMISNVTIGYEKGGFSGRFSVYYQGKTIQNAQANVKSLDVSTDHLLRFDAQLSQKLFIKGLTFYWNLNNLNNWPDRQTLTYYPNFLAHQENYGWTTDIGLRYQF